MLWGGNMSNLDYKVDINSEVTKTNGRQGGLSTKILLGAAGTAAATTALIAGGNKLDKLMTDDFKPKDERKGGISDMIVFVRAGTHSELF